METQNKGLELLKDEKNKILIIHHNDFDGITSGAIAYWNIRKHRKASDITIKTSNSGDFKHMKLVKGKIVFILDLSFPNMEEIAREAKYLVWIDHHETAKQKYNKVWNDETIKGLRDTSKSASLLTWKYFNGEKSIPAIINHANDWDMWFHKFPESTHLNNIVMVKHDVPYDHFWKVMTDIDNSFSTATEREYLLLGKINEGMLLSLQQEILVKKSLKRATFKTFNGTTFVFINNGVFNSLAGSAILESNKDCDIAVLYNIEKNKVSISLRTKKFSCKCNIRKMAEKYGGGGHEHSSGCTVSLFRFLLFYLLGWW